MYQRYVKGASFLLVGIFSFIIGFIMIIKTMLLYDFFIQMVATLLFIEGLALLLKNLFTQNKKVGISKAFFHIFISFLLLIFPHVTTPVLPFLFGIYLILNSIIYGVDYFISRKNKLAGRIHLILKSIFFLFFSIPFLFSPRSNIKHVLILFGIYFIFFGISSIIDCIEEWNFKYKNLLKRKIRVPLPIFLTTFIPYSILREMNEYLQEPPLKPLLQKQNSSDYDLEVFVHVSRHDFTGPVGHVDLWFDDMIISYGGYDMKSRKCKDTIGDGVLFTCDNKEKYIDFCQKYNKKVLFGFGIRLTEQEKKSIKNQLECLKKDMYEWIPYYKRALINHEDVSEEDYNDYVSTLYKMTNATFYKFYGGKFKTFFVFRTSCVALADYILGAAGIDIIKANGFISPGSYYDYLYREFSRKNSMVVSYHVYTKEGDFYE